MTQDEIIGIAREVYGTTVTEQEIRFAALVAAKEREACAKVCETAREAIWEYYEEHLKAASCNVCTNLATAIRARGEQA